MDLIPLNLAADASRRHVLSARPDAPVVPDKVRRDHPGPYRAEPIRRLAAETLRRLADIVEPRRPRTVPADHAVACAANGSARRDPQAEG